MSLLIKGDEVSFILTDKRIIELKAPWVMVQDPEGKGYRRCDVFITSYQPLCQEYEWATKKTLKAAQEYYGDGFEFCTGTVAKPFGPWQKQGEMSAIWYRRYGDREGPFEHKYAVPVSLFANPKKNCYRVALPDGCILDDRGFVSP